jgi:hypothetical protein
MFNIADITASAHILTKPSLPTSDNVEEAASPTKLARGSTKKMLQAQPNEVRAASPANVESPLHPASPTQPSAFTPANPPSPDQKASKSNAILCLLRREVGATLPELMAVTNWQAHSVRGFLSGTVRKKLGLNLNSEVTADGVRRYRIKPSSESGGPVHDEGTGVIDLPPFGPFKGAPHADASTAETVG